jgi:uncharacterized protein
VDRLIEEHQQDLARLCRRYSVQRLEIFGSAVTGGFVASASDLDFLIEFGPMSRGELVERYFGLTEELEELFRRPIDLVMTRAIDNPFFLQAIAPSRTLLYAA